MGRYGNLWNDIEGTGCGTIRYDIQHGIPLHTVAHCGIVQFWHGMLGSAKPRSVMESCKAMNQPLCPRLPNPTSAPTLTTMTRNPIPDICFRRHRWQTISVWKNYLRCRFVRFESKSVSISLLRGIFFSYYCFWIWNLESNNFVSKKDKQFSGTMRTTLMAMVKRCMSTSVDAWERERF